jgi:DNA-directed RNA polymerase subunit RPC12/RpoP
MSGTNWQIEQGCPQCGAPATLAETDRLLACPFCRTRLFLVPEGHFRYHIPPAAAGGDGELFYVPYWRLRGSCFSVALPGIANRFVDASALAVDWPGLPPSLGLRTQVLKLHFVSPATPGRFLSPDRPALKSVPGLDEAQGEGGVFHRRFIGETVSLIYAPLRLRDGALCDAVLGRPVHACTPAESGRLQGAPSGAPGQVRFIATLCPHCGWDLEAQRDSLVLVCRNCSTPWACPGQGFEPVRFAVMTPPPGAGDPACYLPFWRMKPRFTGLELSSWADLIRIANLPRAITPALAGEPLFFWSPAFKVNPALWARWSRQMTVFRPLGEETDRLPEAALHPVTLPLEEAFEGIVINLAQLIMDKRRLYPQLAKLGVSLESSRLEYHPFVSRHGELIHPRLQVAMDRNALAFGLGL